jgi:hypothetical protein
MRMLTNARCRSVAYLLLGGWLAIPAGAAERAIDWSDPPQGVFVDDWMVVELEGQKIGYAHSQMARDGDEIQTTNLMALELRRAGANVPIKVLQTTRETLAGKTRAFTSLLDASAMAMQKQGLIHDGKVVVRSNQFGVESKAEYDFPQGAVMSWGALRRQHTEGYAPGTEYTVQIYEPAFSENMAVPVTMRIGETEALEIGGTTFETIRSTQTMMGMTTTAWMDATGRIVRTELPMMGLPMVMTRSTRAEAMAKFESPEFFMPTTIRSPRPIDREKARLIEFELRLKDDSVVMPEIPTTGMQQPRAIVAAAESEQTKSAAGRVRLVVQRQDHTALAKTPTTEYGPKWNEFLAPNALINSDDPAVVAMARTARGDARLPYAIADRLRRYVTEVIADKNLTVGFATASEVCRNKEGDCSEHAVLLAALGRACGIPTRVVTGLVYVPIFGGDADIFGFHMWTQFRIGDSWVDFDAAQHESDCNPTHIAFSTSSLAGAGLGQISINLVHLIGNLELDIVRIEPAGP